jgi:TPR repeat protein
MRAVRGGRLFDAAIGRLLAKIALRGRMPIEVNWERTYAWEREHSNSAHLLASDPHSNRVYEVFETPDLSEDEEFGIWLSLACDGSVWSMNQVAYLFEIGRGTGQDLAEAEGWYAEASARGSEIAMIRSAHRMASRGDYDGCIAMLQRGVDCEWPPALFWQAWYRLKQCGASETYRSIRPMLQVASQAGHPGADWYLARLMARGVFGPQNKAAGRKRLMKIASVITEEADSSAEA